MSERGNLAITLYLGQSVNIGPVTVTLTGIDHSAKLAIQAPREMPIVRVKHDG